MVGVCVCVAVSVGVGVGFTLQTAPGPSAKTYGLGEDIEPSLAQIVRVDKFTTEEPTTVPEQLVYVKPYEFLSVVPSSAEISYK